MRAPPSITMEPIGVVRSPFADRVSTPRQPHAARGVRGTIELLPGRGLEHAIEDLEGWDHLWVVFWFHLNQGWRSKVLPPRSTKRRGVLSTRSPHRPNPIGLSLVRLESIEGLTLTVLDVDMIDGTPVLDLKPYVPYADARPNAKTGWLEPLAPEDAGAGEAGAPIDPVPSFEVAWSELARAQASWLFDAHRIDVATPIERTLRLGPQPHPYRRIRRDGDALRLAVKDWRARFRVDGRRVTVDAIATGYREPELATSDDPTLAPHREFVARFGR